MNKGKKRLIVQFSMYALGDFLAFSALNFTINMQSSINIEGGLGTNALAVTFSTAIIFGLLSTPIVLRKLGPKFGLITSELMMTIYIASNYYPAYFTMIPAAVMMGFSEGTIWPSMVLMNVYFGSEYCSLKGKDEKSGHYVNLFSGCFFTVHHLNQVLGGLTAFFILRDVDEAEVAANSTLNPANSSTSLKLFERCGSRDCQMDAEVGEAINNYTPTKRLKLVILLSCFMAMCFTAISLHGFLLPNSRELRKNLERKNDVKAADMKSEEESSAIVLKRVGDSEAEKLAETVEVESSFSKKADTGFTSTIVRSVKGVGKQLLKPNQLLILPLTFYHGLLTTYILAELPRAFVSCVSGYAMISLYSCVFGLGHVSSYLVGRFAKTLGRIFILVAAAALDIANLLFCLFWNPSIGTSWLIFLSYFVFGMTDGTWQLCLNLTHVVYFPENKEVAGSVWATFLNLGLAVQFAWSTNLCVYTKIYVMLATLTLGIVLFCIAENRHKKTVRKSTAPKQNERVEDLSKHSRCSVEC